MPAGLGGQPPQDDADHQVQNHFRVFLRGAHLFGGQDRYAVVLFIGQQLTVHKHRGQAVHAGPEDAGQGQGIALLDDAFAPGIA